MRAATWHCICLLSAGLVAASATAETGPASARLQDGEAIYRYVCARCHDHAEGGAPVIGEPETWRGRSSLWEAVLFEHAEKGWLAMPAGGGDARLSQYDIDVAAEYMVQKTFPDRPED